MYHCKDVDFMTLLLSESILNKQSLYHLSMDEEWAAWTSAQHPHYIKDSNWGYTSFSGCIYASSNKLTRSLHSILIPPKTFSWKKHQYDFSDISTWFLHSYQKKKNLLWFQWHINKVSTLLSEKNTLENIVNQL